MCEKTLNQLPAETVKLIASTQIITSVSTAVKELIENSLDAQARNIQVKLDNYGFDALEVRDDGIGISYINIQRMFLSGYTSKIACFNDLGRLQTYGFRGEALSALAKLSNVSITTKTSSDALAMTYAISHDGIPESSKPSHLAKGTVITATNIFSKLPVRKQYLSSRKKASEELKKVEYVVQSLSVIHPELRITLCHNKCPIWQKNSVKGMKQSFMQVVGLKIVTKIEHLNELDNNILVDLIIPKKNMDNIDNIFSNTIQNMFLYVNRRPVMLSKVSKLVTDHVCLHYTQLDPSAKYATCLISIEVPPQEVDVNLEPNKTKVFLKNEVDVLNLIDHMLSCYYKQTVNRPLTVDLKDSKEEDLNMGWESGEEENESKQRKRRCLESAKSSDEVSILRDHEFSGKNDGWQLEVITSHDSRQRTDASLSLCSQINMDNCTLTSSQEVGELKKLLSENSKLLVTSLNVDSEKRLASREELQDCNKLKTVETVAQTDSAANTDGRILPSWPVRQISKATVESKDEDQENVSNVEDDVKDVNDQVEREARHVHFSDNIDLVEWSKGTVDTGDGLIPSGAVLAKPTHVSDRGKGVAEEGTEQFDLSVRSVSSHMGKKELSAFSKFARIMRPKILDEFPGMVFTNVARMLVDRWKSLSIDDKTYYEKLAKAVDPKRGNQMKNRALDEYKTEAPPPIKEREATAHKQKRYVLKVTVTLENIIQKWSARGVDNSNDNLQLMGQLQPSGHWLYKKGNCIGHVRHSGLQELILSHKMRSSHSVPRQPLPEPILINECVLGRELWDVLTGMDTEFDGVSCRYTVVSDAVSKNGFKIDMEKREDGFAFAWITEAASMIPFHGVAELRETLTLYRTQGEFADLGNLRCTAVNNYITNEVIRIVQQTPRPPDFADILALLDTWHLFLKHLPPRCLHSRDIFVPFYHLTP